MGDQPKAAIRVPNPYWLNPWRDDSAEVEAHNRKHFLEFYEQEKSDD